MGKLHPSRTHWRDALKYCVRSKPREYADDNWSVCLKQHGGASVWKHYKTEEEAWDALHTSREEFLLDSLADYELDPDEAKVFLDKYLVFDNGMIFNMNGKRIEGCLDNHGYLVGQFEGIRVGLHTLVASMFIPNPTSYHRNVAHKDGDKLNNAASNLKWTCMSERWEELKATTDEENSRKNSVISRLSNQLIDNENLRNKLPKVGMCLRKRSLTAPDGERHECVVTYVNRNKLWYEVQFLDGYGGGFKECFKLPEHTPGYSG